MRVYSKSLLCLRLLSNDKPNSCGINSAKKLMWHYLSLVPTNIVEEHWPKMLLLLRVRLDWEGRERGGGGGGGVE